MKIVVEFDPDNETLAWIWIQWLYENSPSPRMPESLDELREVASDHLRNQGHYDNQTLFDCVRTEITDQLRKDDNADDVNAFSERVVEHIKGLE